MPEAVVLGVVGVVRSRAELWSARIEAVVAGLEPHGVPAAEFRRAAYLRLRRDGERALVSRTLADLKVRVPAALERRLVLTARQALPPASPCPSLRAALRQLGTSYRVAFLDDGDPSLLQSDIERLGLGGVAEFCLWTGALGLQARDPSPLGFRWVANRLQLRPGSCLYVAGSEARRRAAEQAGWQAWGALEAGPGPGDTVDLDVLVDRLSTLDCGVA